MPYLGRPENEHAIFACGLLPPYSLPICVQLVYKKWVLKGLKMELSNAESTTDS